MNETLTFENALKRLEDIVSELEKGDLELENSLALFEEGTKLSAQCYQKLADAKLKVTSLQKENEVNEDDGVY